MNELFVMLGIESWKPVVAALKDYQQFLVLASGELTDLDDIRRATPVWQDPALDADWKESIRMLIERAWRGVRGQG